VARRPVEWIFADRSAAVSTCSPDCLAYERLAAALPLAFVQGDYLPFAVVVNRDLSGYTLAAAIVNAASGATVVSFAVTQAPVMVSGATHTRVSLSLTANQTATLTTPNAYRWWFRWTTPAGETRTILAGRVRAVRR
jgi:hypothetical protein